MIYQRFWKPWTLQVKKKLELGKTEPCWWVQANYLPCYDAQSHQHWIILVDLIFGFEYHLKWNAEKWVGLKHKIFYEKGNVRLEISIWRARSLVKYPTLRRKCLPQKLWHVSICNRMYYFISRPNWWNADLWINIALVGWVLLELTWMFYARRQLLLPLGTMIVARFWREFVQNQFILHLTPNSFVEFLLLRKK